MTLSKSHTCPLIHPQWMKQQIARVYLESSWRKRFRKYKLSLLKSQLFPQRSEDVLSNLSYSPFSKALFYLNTMFLCQKSASARSAFLGQKQSHTVTLAERQILLNVYWAKTVLFFFPSTKNCSNCLRKRNNMMFIPVYRCLTTAPSEVMCLQTASW